MSIIISLLLLSSLSCTKKETVTIRYFEDFVECPATKPEPSLTKIPKFNHVGSVEEQNIIIRYVKEIVEYAVAQKARLECFDQQVEAAKKRNEQNKVDTPGNKFKE